MTAPRAVLAGGNGFLGQSLARVLVAEGWSVDVLTRRPAPAAAGRQVQWDGATLGEWAGTLDGASAVVNFTGKSVNCRYTPANRREIVRSRVESVRAIGEAIARCSAPPPVWIQAGSLAIYGNPGEAIVTEESPPGPGFSPSVCRQWEAAFDAVVAPTTRKVLLRMGFALGVGGGALETLARLARLGLGGRAGSGISTSAGSMDATSTA